MAGTTITLDTYKQQIGSQDAFNLKESFNGRVGDEQVPLTVRLLEHGHVHQFDDELVPFITGFVGDLDEDGRVTAETGTAVSYVGSRSDIIGLGKFKMHLPGTMFPQEGYFYGFLGLETPDHSHRESTFSVWFHVYNGNPDMFVNKEPFRTELQKLLDSAQALINAADGQVKAKLLEWQTQINELITNLNGSYANIQATVNLIKEGLSSLEDKIKQDGLLTQADLNDFKIDINDRISKLEEQEESGELMTDVGGGVREIFKDGISNMRAQIDPNLANIGMITDVHYTDRDNYWGPDNAAETGITHILNIAAISDLLDFAASCGDNTDDNWPDNHFSLKRIMDYGTTWFTSMQCPSAILLGNHDDNSSHAVGGKAVGNDYLVPDSYIAKAYRNDLNLYGEHRNGDSNYYYYDIPDKNVRVIGVNDYENPNTLDSSNKLKYPRINTSIITADQIKWLASDALNVDVNTHVMIMMHCPINGTNKDNPAETCINHDVLKQLLEAFVSGKTGTLVGVNADFPVNVDYNFANKGNLIGVFAGHVHADDYKQVNGINYILSLNSVGCSGNQPNVTTYYDTADEDSWAVIGVDTADRHVKMSKFGRGSDMNFDY